MLGGTRATIPPDDALGVGVMNRWSDWWEQAARDLAHARHALDDADYEWAAFAAQQSAEKALKALVMALGGEPWGQATRSWVKPSRAGWPC